MRAHAEDHRGRRGRLIGAVGLVAGLIVMAFVVDQAGLRPPIGIRWWPGQGQANVVAYAQGAAVALAAVGAWLLASRTVEALIGLGLAVGLVAFGVLASPGVLVLTAEIFAIPLTAVMLIRVIVHLKRTSAAPDH